MNMHIVILMNLHAKYIAKNNWIIYYKLFVFLNKDWQRIWQGYFWKPDVCYERAGKTAFLRFYLCI